MDGDDSGLLPLLFGGWAFDVIGRDGAGLVVAMGIRSQAREDIVTRRARKFDLILNPPGSRWSVIFVFVGYRDVDILLT